jgi:hypothetical protein
MDYGIQYNLVFVLVIDLLPRLTLLVESPKA